MNEFKKNKIDARIIELESELEQLRSQIPAHSMKPEMLLRMEDLEDELKQLRLKKNE
jgi:hypothetical protein